MAVCSRPLHMGENIPAHAGTQGILSAQPDLHVYSRSSYTSTWIPVQNDNTYLIPACPPVRRTVFHGHVRSQQSDRRRTRLLKTLPPLRYLRTPGIHRRTLRVHCVPQPAAAPEAYPAGRSDKSHQCARSPRKGLLKGRKTSRHGRAPGQRYSGIHQRS